MKIFGFEHSPADAYTRMMRLVESGAVSIVAVVHVDYMLAVGRKSRCDQFFLLLEPLCPYQQLGRVKVVRWLPFFSGF